MHSDYRFDSLLFIREAPSEGEGLWCLGSEKFEDRWSVRIKKNKEDKVNFKEGIWYDKDGKVNWRESYVGIHCQYNFRIPR